MQRGTRTEAAMSQRLSTLEPGSTRYEALATAIDFKRSWLQLAEALSEVQRGGEFGEWGYRTFEAYAQSELHLRRETVQKLLRSYGFLQNHESEVLEPNAGDEAPPPLPSYQALDVLAQARENPYLSENDYKELRDHVFEGDATPAQARKLVRDRAPEPAEPGSEASHARLRKCLALAERLYGLLVEEQDVPDSVSRSMEQVVGSLRKLLDDE